MTTLKLKNQKVKNDGVEQIAIQTLFNIIIAVPTIVLGLLMAFYLLVALEVGHFPAYGNPDPKYSNFAFLHTPVIFGIIGMMATIPIWLLMSGINLIRGRIIPNIKIKAVIYFLPIIAFFLINYYSPVMVWLMD